MRGRHGSAPRAGEIGRADSRRTVLPDHGLAADMPQPVACIQPHLGAALPIRGQEDEDLGPDIAQDMLGPGRVLRGADVHHRDAVRSGRLRGLTVPEISRNRQGVPMLQVRCRPAGPAGIAGEIRVEDERRVPMSAASPASAPAAHS